MLASPGGGGLNPPLDFSGPIFFIKYSFHVEPRKRPDSQFLENIEKINGTNFANVGQNGSRFCAPAEFSKNGLLLLQAIKMFTKKH